MRSKIDLTTESLAFATPIALELKQIKILIWNVDA
jgi:hypothetical protein